jgi:hypothetical protein
MTRSEVLNVLRDGGMKSNAMAMASSQGKWFN